MSRDVTSLIIFSQRCLSAGRVQCFEIFHRCSEYSLRLLTARETVADAIKYTSTARDGKLSLYVYLRTLFRLLVTVLKAVSLIRSRFSYCQEREKERKNFTYGVLLLSNTVQSSFYVQNVHETNLYNYRTHFSNFIARKTFVQIIKLLHIYLYIRA